MSRFERTFVRGPRVLARDALGHGRWAYIVEAPFDMPANAPDLLGRPISLDGRLFDIRGLVSKLPSAQIAAGELIELLVAEASHIELAQPSATEMDRV